MIDVNVDPDFSPRAAMALRMCDCLMRRFRVQTGPGGAMPVCFPMPRRQQDAARRLMLV